MDRLIVLIVILKALMLTGCLDQYRPEGYWASLAKDRQTASVPTPKLTAEGKLPLAQKVVAPGTFDVAKVYASNCVACHGAKGEGNAALQARSFLDKDWQAVATDAQIAAVILHGALQAANFEPSLKERTTFKLQHATMIGWPHLFDSDPTKRKEQLDAFVAYIRAFNN